MNTSSMRGVDRRLGAVMMTGRVVSRRILGIWGLSSILFGAGACTKHQQAAAQQAHGGATQTAVGNACDRKLLTMADVEGILTERITGSQTIQGDPATCTFTTGSFPSITVTLRPKVGKATVATWRSGRMPSTATPLTGVGDEAVWVDDLHEVVAQKNNLLCDIQALGISKDRVNSTSAEQQKLGALCNKIFAAQP